MRLNTLPEVTQPVSSKARIQLQQSLLGATALNFAARPNFAEVVGTFEHSCIRW